MRPIRRSSLLKPPTAVGIQGFDVDQPQQHLPEYLSAAEGKPSMCTQVFKQFQDYYELQLMYQYKYPNHEESIKALFLNGTYDFRNNANFQKCFALENELSGFIEGQSKIVPYLKDLGLNLTKASSFSEALYYAQQIMVYYSQMREVLLAYNDYSPKAQGTCYWYLGIVDEVSRELLGVKSSMYEAADLTKSSLVELGYIAASFGKLDETFKKKITLIFNWNKSTCIRFLSVSSVVNVSGALLRSARIVTFWVTS